MKRYLDEKEYKEIKEVIDNYYKYRINYYVCDICKKYDISSYHFSKIFYSKNFNSYRNPEKKLDDKRIKYDKYQKDKIFSDYKDGIKVSEICKKYNMKRGTLYFLLNTFNIDINRKNYAEKN